MHSGGSRNAYGRALRRSSLWLLVCGLSGCMRLGYDLLTETATASEPFDDLTPTSAGPGDTRRGVDAGSAPDSARAPFSPGQALPPRPDGREAIGDVSAGWDSLTPR